MHVRRLAAVSDGQLEELAKLLIDCGDCVDGGASVSFMHPLPMTDALAFWAEAARRRGLGAAREAGKSLLVLDTASAEAGRLVRHDVLLPGPRPSLTGWRRTIHIGEALCINLRWYNLIFSNLF